MSAPQPEFSRILRLNELGHGPIDRALEADEAERMALARRFGLRALTALTARIHVAPEADGALVTGRLVADLVQACVATDEDVPAHLDAPFAVRFACGLEASGPDAELELSDEISDAECDLLPLEVERVDLGETVAQSLALNLDPYPRVPDADEKLRALGVLS